MLRAFLSHTSQRCCETILLDNNETHHLVKVRRVKTGERVEVLDGNGLILDCEYVSTQGKQAQLKVLNSIQNDAPAIPVCIAQAMLKNKSMDLFIQKAIELSATTIQPLLTENSEIRIDKQQGEKKSNKWQQHAIEAIKQSGNPWLPTIHAPVNIKDWIGDTSSEKNLKIIGSLESDAIPLPQLFSKIQTVKQISILIGPEGDFSAAEYELARRHDWQPGNFGTNVLRAETASIFALSIASYERNKLKNRKTTD